MPELFHIENFNLAARIFRAINHPLRQKMLQLIHKHNAMSVTDLYVSLRLEQSVASQHLSILRKAGFVKTHRDGKQIFYSIYYERLNELKKISQLLISVFNVSLN